MLNCRAYSIKDVIAGNKLFFLLLLLILPFTAICQITPSVPKWVSDIGGPGSCISSYLRVDAQNNTYVTGIFEGTIDFDPSVSTFNLTATGGFDAFVAKYNTNGNLIWAKSMGGAGTDQPSGMDLDNNGNVTIVGQFNSPMDANPGAGTFSLNNASDFDMFIINLDANGNFLWAKSIGGSGADYGNKVAVDKDGNRIMIGQFQQTVQVGTATYSTSGTFNGLIAKYDAAGNYLWSFSLGATGDNKGVGIDTDNNKDIIISGTFSGAVNFNPLGASYNLSSPGTASYIAKYTSSGQLIWVKVINGNTATNIAVDRSSNNIFATGTYSTVIFDPANTLNATAGQAMFIARYAQDGSFIWAKGIDGSNASVSNNGITVKNDNVYISGYFNGTVDFDGSAGSAIINYHGQRDLFLLKYNVDGDYQWAVTAGNNSCSNTLGRAVGVDGYNDILFSGTFCSTVNFDVSGCSSYNLTATSPTRDAFLAKYTPSAAGLASNTITAPAITSFCGPFDPAIILGSTPTGGAGTYDYHWQSSTNGVNFTDIPGAVGKDYDPPSITATVYYRRIVGSGNCNLDISSNIVQIIQQNTTANNTITAPSVAQFCGSGDPDIITGSIPTGNNGAYTYQWQSSTDGVNFSDLTGATLKDFDPSVITNTTYFRRKVNPGTCEIISNAIKIDVAPQVVNNIITAAPGLQFCDFGDPGFLTGSTPAGGIGTYAYQWQSSADGVNYTDLAGATSKDYDPPVINATTYYRRKVVSGGCETLSNVVQVIVQPSVSANQITPPAINSFCISGDPEAITGNVPQGGDGTYTYQWQNSPDGVVFFDIPGATQQNYDPPVITESTSYRRAVNSGFCGIMAYSNITQIFIHTQIINAQITAPAVANFCGAGDPGIIAGGTPTGGNGTYTYQWQSSTDGVNFVDIVGATLKDYDPPVISITSYYQRKVISGTCDMLSNVVKISIQPSIINNQLTTPAAVSFCSSTDPDAITGSTPTGGNGTYAYQWQSSNDGTNFTDITGATLKDFDPPVINSTVYYQRIVSSGSCATSVSNIIQFSAQPAIANNQINAPSAAAFCGNGDPDVISGSTPTGGNGSYTFQWQSSADGANFTDVSGATSKDFDPPVINSTVYYRRKVTSGSCETWSNVIQLTVQPTVSANAISAQPPTAFCIQGDPGVITGNIPPGAFTYLYQWQSSADNVAFTDIPGATANSYDPPLLTATTYYRRIVSSAVCVVPLISNVVVIQVDPALANNTITSPAVNSFCSGGDPDIIVGSTPSGGNGTINYQWQNSVDGLAFANISGANQKDFDPGLLNSTIFYRRIVTSGNCTVPLVSNAVKITIDPVVTGNSIVAPAVTTFCGNSQPGTVTGSTPSGGNGLYNYQWQNSADNISFADILNATQKDYAPGVLNSSTYYRRIVTSGNCTVPVVSNSVLIQIVPVVSNNAIAPPVVSAFCSSGDPSLISGSTPTGGTGAYVYLWQSSTDGIAFSDITGATAKDYDPPIVTITTYFRRIVASGICNIPQNSNVIKITVDAMPAITLQPEVTICQGANTTLNATGGNNSFTYQWSPAAGLSNTNSANPMASPTITTLYTLTVSNGVCSTTITTTVNVIPPPTVNAGSDKEILKGNSVLLDAVVTGNNLQYSWSPALYLDDPNIANPTASPPEDITYTLTVTSPNNCFVVFDDVFVKVYPKIAPPNTFTPNNDGVNDTWEIPGLSSYAGGVISIFNRNGELLHKSVGYTRSWDGTYKGKVVPFGTYYYTIDLKNGKSVLSGWVAVIK